MASKFVDQHRNGLQQLQQHDGMGLVRFGIVDQTSGPQQLSQAASQFAAPLLAHADRIVSIRLVAFML